MTGIRLFFTALFSLVAAAVCGAAAPERPVVSLVESLSPSPVTLVEKARVRISGSTTSGVAEIVRVRVTTSRGTTHQAEVRVQNGRFECAYPQYFPGAPALASGVLYADATELAEFGTAEARGHQAEIVLIVSGGREDLPDLPLLFMDDFLDAQGRADQAADQWARQQVLLQLFMRSRGAMLMRLHRPDFDPVRPDDFQWFKDRASLYDFDHRDRDWSTPLSNRVARGFWQAVWNRWFNASNNHPWDGNPDNRQPENYRPYTFTNDPADLLVLYDMLRHVKPVVADNRQAMADEVMRNLLALQHRGPDNFALPEASGRQEYYTSGAFRYGMFETGEWLTEGKGWFTNPRFRDFAWGGVFNGRAVWALGESLKANPQGPLASGVREALALALRYCLHDGLEHGYTLRSPSGLPVWCRTPGEHAYLLLGMLAACEVMPDWPLQLDPAQPARPLRDVTIDALRALAELAGPDGQWTHYANSSAMNIAALAEGARVFRENPDATIWKAAAMKAADGWLALKAHPERAEPTPMFGHRSQGDAMTFLPGPQEKAHVPLYISGHWLHALAVLHRVTGAARFFDRASVILGYYCGNNPLRVRLLNELGAVNNRVTDTDGDGLEDSIHWDAYPESTAFVQIGLLHLLQN
jgi:hypothetical protein